MKKGLLIVAMIICMFCLAACGEEEAQSGPISQEMATEVGTTIVDQMNKIVVNDAIQQSVGDNAVLVSGFEGWKSALTEIGTYEGVSGVSMAFEEGEVILTVEVLGSLHNAAVEIILDDKLATYIGITTNIHYSTGEIMWKAFLNTVIGMGTVFAVLILISLIISCFTLISRFENRKVKEETAPAAAPVVQQIAAKEELSDDTELVAVIAAAIAAYEGAASTDGFVVRSIRKSNKSKWQNA